MPIRENDEITENYGLNKPTYTFSPLFLFISMPYRLALTNISFILGIKRTVKKYTITDITELNKIGKINFQLSSLYITFNILKIV